MCNPMQHSLCRKQLSHFINSKFMKGVSSQQNTSNTLMHTPIYNTVDSRLPSNIKLFIMSFNPSKIQPYVINDLVPITMKTHKVVKNSLYKVNAFILDDDSLSIDWVKHRSLPSQGQPIMPVNINGGITHSWDSKKLADVLVFRREDCTKVYSHELLHALAFDETIPFNDIETPQYDLPNKCKFPLKYSLREAIVESLACIICGNNNVDRSNEIARNVIDHFKGKEINMDTNVFSYTICRAAILSNELSVKQITQWAASDRNPDIANMIVSNAINTWIHKNYTL